MAKGQNDCCCGGCNSVPWDLNIDERGLQPVQQYCCACIPKYVCVSYICRNVETHAELVLPCVDEDYLDKKHQYRVNFPGIGLLRFYFDVEEDEYGQKQCYFYLTSDFFYNDPDPVLVDDYFRGIFCLQCEGCDDGTDYIQFDVNSPDCGDAWVRIRPAGVVSNPRLPDCCDCPDPCADVEYPEEEKNCDTCGGCQCICSNACLTVLRNGTAFSATAPNCNNRYDFSNGMSVTLRGDPTSNCCGLELDTGDIVPSVGSVINSVPIDPTENPCPFPTAQWTFYEEGKEDPEDIIIVHFSCLVCGECGAIITDCCPDAVPAVLTATISGSSYCCDGTQLTLIYDSVTQVWVGEDLTGWCDDGNIRIELGCSNGEFVISFEANNCVSVDDSAVNEGGSCEPMDLEFDITLDDTNPGVGPFCCPESEGPHTVTITVTE